MTLSISQSTYAVGRLGPAAFGASGGADPYTFSVLPGGAGGTIDPSSGLYTGPNALSSNPQLNKDTIQVEDDDGATATTTILVGTPLLLLCDIVQREMGLANGRVYLWDQKLMQPKDNDLYVAVAMVSCKPFGNNNRATDEADQYVSMSGVVTLDAISRGPAARDRKEEIVLALNSIYSQQQQAANGFYVASLPMVGGFKNLSEVDGAAIPYRYQISVVMQYCYQRTQEIAYYDDFSEAEVNIDPPTHEPEP